MSRLRRTFTIIARLLPFVWAFLRDRRRWVLFGGPRPVSRAAHERRAERLTRTIAALGPTFIKLAQVFSARADILPEPYLSAVGRLHDRVPPDPVEEIEHVIRSELGRSPDEVFAAFEREPAAAASLAQVHRAQIDGERVAVKVLRPGVGRLVAVDLDISFRVLYVLNVLFPNQHVRAFTNALREFSVRIREEMDFRGEAEHIERFQEYFASDDRVRAPRVYDEFTARRLLVLEWVEADKVNDLEQRFESGELEFREFMETLTETYLRMLLVDGFLHADPHPGNILVDPDGAIVFLDWGMVIQLSRPTRDRILRLALAAGRDDIDAMVDGMYSLGMIDPEIGRAEVRDAATEILRIVDRTGELGARRVQELVREILDTFYAWPLVLPRELVYFFRASALLEGIGFRYDPDFNGLDIARPVIRRMRGELVSATGEPTERLRRFAERIASGVSDLGRVLERAEREEFRVRVHPSDIRQAEHYLYRQVRRVLLSIFALTIALIASITFLAVESVWLLAGGLAVAFFMFVLVFLVPSHLLENPLRRGREVRPGERGGRTPPDRFNG